MTIQNKASERVFGGQTVVDIPAASPRLAQKVVEMNAGTFTQNLTVRTGSAFVVPYPMTLVAANLAAETVVIASGGTLSSRVVANIPVVGAVNLTDTINPQAMTTRVAQPLVLATTNVELPAGTVVQVQNVTSNHAVGTQAVGFTASLVFRVAEEAVIDV
jgi:hypothetical protein